MILSSLLPTLLLFSIVLSEQTTSTAQNGFVSMTRDFIAAVPRQDFAGNEVNSTFDPGDLAYQESMIRVSLAGILLSAICFFAVVGFAIGRFCLDKCGRKRQTQAYSVRNISFWKIFAFLVIILVIIFTILGYVGNSGTNGNILSFFKVIDDTISDLESSMTNISSTMTGFLLYQNNQTTIPDNITALQTSLDKIKTLQKDAEGTFLMAEDYRLFLTHSSIALGLAGAILLLVAALAKKGEISWDAFWCTAVSLPIFWLGFAIHLPAAMMTDDFCFTNNSAQESLSFFLSCLDNQTLQQVNSESFDAKTNITLLINATSCPNGWECWLTQNDAETATQQEMETIYADGCAGARSNYSECGDNNKLAHDWLKYNSGSAQANGLANCSYTQSAFDDIHTNICTDLLNSVSMTAGALFFLGLFAVLQLVAAGKGGKRFQYAADSLSPEFEAEDTGPQTSRRHKSTDESWWSKLARKHDSSDDEDSSDQEEVLAKGVDAAGRLEHQTLHQVNQVKTGKRVPEMSEDQWEALGTSDDDDDESVIHVTGTHTTANAIISPVVSENTDNISSSVINTDDMAAGSENADDVEMTVARVSPPSTPPPVITKNQTLGLTAAEKNSLRLAAAADLKANTSSSSSSSDDDDESDDDDSGESESETETETENKESSQNQKSTVSSSSDEESSSSEEE